MNTRGGSLRRLAVVALAAGLAVAACRGVIGVEDLSLASDAGGSTADARVDASPGLDGSVDGAVAVADANADSAPVDKATCRANCRGNKTDIFGPLNKQLKEKGTDCMCKAGCAASACGTTLCKAPPPNPPDVACIACVEPVLAASCNVEAAGLCAQVEGPLVGKPCTDYLACIAKCERN